MMDDSKRLMKIIEIQSHLVEANFDLLAFMNLVVKEIETLTPATGVVVELVEGDDMVYKAASGTIAPHLGLRLARKGSISGLCVEQKEILRSNDTETDSRVNLSACRLVQARSMVVAPLFNQGQAVGVLKILSKEPNAFSEPDVETLKLMANLIGAALAHQMDFASQERKLSQSAETVDTMKKFETELQFIAHHDFLTKLPNRSLLNERLRSAMLRSKHDKELIAVMFLDIDHFKQINDTLGHHSGDKLLVTFAERISTVLREMDTLARLGGDEFVILLESFPNKEYVEEVANQIIQKVNQPLVLNQKEVTISTSIGVSFYQGEDLTPEDFLQKADNELYKAKRTGRNRVSISN